MLRENKRLIGILITAALILLIPFIAMQFTEDVNWDLLDFTVAGLLLLTAGLIVELVIRVVKKTRYRIILYIVIFAVLLLIWAELAVGILGTPFAGT